MSERKDFATWFREAEIWLASFGGAPSDIPWNKPEMWQGYYDNGYTPEDAVHVVMSGSEV